MINSSYLVLPTLADRAWLKNSLVVIAASFVIALFALISIPLPFSPVPLVTQAQVVLLLSVVLGSKRAVAAVLLYLAQGAMGFPVFSGGMAGWVILAGPTGGYLLGYAAAAFITGWLAERVKEQTPLKAFSVMAVGNLIIFVFGSIWLSQFLGWQGAWMLGVVPFLLGDLFKLIIATRVLRACRFFSSV